MKKISIILAGILILMMIGSSVSAYIYQDSNFNVSIDVDYSGFTFSDSNFNISSQISDVSTKRISPSFNTTITIFSVTKVATTTTTTTVPGDFQHKGRFFPLINTDATIGKRLINIIQK
jgi:hypothetical protein